MAPGWPHLLECPIIRHLRFGLYDFWGVSGDGWGLRGQALFKEPTKIAQYIFLNWSSFFGSASIQCTTWNSVDIWKYLTFYWQNKKLENSQLIFSYFTTFKKKIIKKICMLNSCFDSSYLCISLNLKGMSHEKKKYGSWISIGALWTAGCKSRDKRLQMCLYVWFSTNFRYKACVRIRISHSSCLIFKLYRILSKICLPIPKTTLLRFSR